MLEDLAALPGNRFEVLKGDRKGQYSIRITINGESVLAGPTSHPGRPMSKSWITTEDYSMARTPIHPGEHLAEELKDLGMSAAELARRLGVPTNRVTSILNGRRAITGDTALRLAHFFGTSAEFWLNLQNLYELRLAEQKNGKSIKKLPTLKRAKVA
jgi:addiction module HigA family antidote